MTARHYAIVVACLIKLALGVYLVEQLSNRLHRAHLSPSLTENHASLKETQAL